MTERNGADMSLENDPKPTWTDPATAAPASAQTDPAGEVAPIQSAAPTVAPAVSAAPPVRATPAPRKRSGAWVNLLLGAAAIIAVAGVAFAVGRSTAPVAASSVGTFQGGRNSVVIGPGGSFDPGAVPADGFGGRGMFGSGGPSIEGTIASIDGETMTLKLASGETMTVTLDGDTTYHEATSATVDDVAVGDDVSVRLSGGRVQAGGDGVDTTPTVTADDVTVSR